MAVYMAPWTAACRYRHTLCTGCDPDRRVEDGDRASGPSSREGVVVQRWKKVALVRHILQEAFQKRKGFNSNIQNLPTLFLPTTLDAAPPAVFFLSSTFLLARFSDTQPSLSYGYSSRARAQEGKPALLGPHTETSSRPDQGAQGLRPQRSASGSARVPPASSPRAESSLPSPHPPSLRAPLPRLPLPKV